MRAGVRYYLRWVSDNRAAARFLLGERPAADATLRARNREFFGEVTAWWDTHVHYGALRSLPFDVDQRAVARPGAGVHPPLDRRPRRPRARVVADELADAAWQNLKEER